MQTHRTLPQRKTLGTAYNLRPDTESVPARALREGDVVLEGPEHPAVVVRIGRTPNPVRVYVRYIWQPLYEPPWLMGEYRPDRHIDRAKPGEY
jgi:hypothetical protein